MACHNLNWFLCALCVISLPFTYMAFEEPDNEFLKDLMLKLLDYTGLSNNTSNHTITGISCSDELKGKLTQCTINPKGNIVWDVRYEMYSRNIYAFENNSISLDGCQTTSPGNTSQLEYTACMKEVRTNMKTYLIHEFETKFKELLAPNCSGLAKDNCVGE